MSIITRYTKAIENRVTLAYCSHRDFRTKRHIVIFESDDWGSIRMPKRDGWEELLRMGYAVDKRPYERYDTLESSVDLEALFEVLSRHSDRNGNHPVITANMLMANPDFDQIRQSGYRDYHYERVAESYARYNGNSKVLDLMRQGMDEGIFLPQSHGREHFNVAHWMRGLQNGDEDLMTAFRFGVCGIAPKAHPEKGNSIMKALLAENEKEQDAIDSIVDEGLRMFEELWGFKSRTFVAPCYLWNERTEQILSRGGVQLIQTSRTNKPSYRSSSNHFYFGQKNNLGQLYSIRNCTFEPATNPREENPNYLMDQVDTIFSEHKIAVFSTHRINYVGGIDESNRTRTLGILDEFLTLLFRKYPDVEFLSSDKLIDIIR